MSAEDDVRTTLAAIDEKRAHARLLSRMAEWPMFAPSSVRADKRRGLFRWFGSVSPDALTEVELTSEERSELREWFDAKSARLRSEADALSASLESKDQS